MKTSTLTCLTLLGAVAVLAVPSTVWADHRATVLTDPRATVANENRVINKLLTARDDDDREDAADALAKWGTARALSALDYAAANDREDDVRRHARRAANRIRERLGAYVTPAPVVTPCPPVVVRPAPVVVRPAPVIVPRWPVVVRPPVAACPPVVVRPPVIHRPPVIVRPPAPSHHRRSRGPVRTYGGCHYWRSSIGFQHRSSGLGIGFRIAF